VEPIDQSILDALAASRPDKPADDGSGLLVGVGAILVVLAIGTALWSWYHRSSRYFPA
jgi:hypothetical protein